MKYSQRFSRLNRKARLAYLEGQGALMSSERALLETAVGEDFLKLADQFIESALGCFPLPLGLVPDFPLNGRHYLVPMVIEETSVVAAVNKMAKWIRQEGELSAKLLGEEIIGQIHFPLVKDFTAFQAQILAQAQALIAETNTKVLASLVARGAGLKRLEVRELPRATGPSMAVVHLFLHPGEAMGANLVTQAAEFLKPRLAALTETRAGMAILSNLTDSRLVRVDLCLRKVAPEVSEAIEEAAEFAHCDPYRAATHNKGIMNGMDALVIATGNDWRAVEAGVHAYAARSGQYRGLSEWRREDENLIGSLTLPVAVGTVGGVTRLHPLAQLSLRLLKIENAKELSTVIAALGLVQNLAALRALTQEGIVAGHMFLHLENLLLAVGATEKEQIQLKPLAKNFLKMRGKITESDIGQLLRTLRKAE